MSAVKNGNHIDINSTGGDNTLASITTDIGDTTFLEKTGTSPDIYTVKGNVTRYLRILNGATLIIGSELDYTNNETLELDNDANNRTSFYNYAGGTLKQYGATTIDFGKDTYYPAHSYIYGKVDCLGDGTNNPTWKNFNRVYFYEQTTENTYPNDVWHFEDMTFGGGCATTSYCPFFYAIGKIRNHIFKNITCDKTVGRNTGNTYFFYFSLDNDGFDGVTLEGIDFDNVYYGGSNVVGVPLHWKNCTWTTTVSWALLNRMGPSSRPWATDKNFSNNDPIPLGQRFTYYEGCTFKDTGPTAYVEYGAVCCFKNCEWQNTTSVSAEVQYDGRMLFWTGNTFTGGVSTISVAYDGARLNVFDLTLTVEDTGGNAIEDAIVFIKQKDGKEQFTFRTTSTGVLENIHELGCALLTNRYYYTSTSSTYWSDASNSTYHEVYVFKKGYEPRYETYVMDQARSDTIVLREISTLKVEM